MESDRTAIPASSHQLNAAHILIVEDDFKVAESIADILRTLRGDICTIIRSKPVAEEHMRRQRPDLVILDYKLLGGSSSVLARLASNMQIPAVVISGHDVAERAKVQGLPFLQKPFTADQLLELLATLLER